MSGLDTQNRRRSAVSFGMVTVLPQADGSVDAADSAHTLGVYCGFWEKVLALLRLPGRILHHAVASVILRRTQTTAIGPQVLETAGALQTAKLAASVQNAQPSGAGQTAQAGGGQVAVLAADSQSAEPSADLRTTRELAS